MQHIQKKKKDVKLMYDYNRMQFYTCNF